MILYCYIEAWSGADCACCVSNHDGAIVPGFVRETAFRRSPPSEGKRVQSNLKSGFHVLLQLSHAVARTGFYYETKLSHLAAKSKGNRDDHEARK